MSEPMRGPVTNPGARPIVLLTNPIDPAGLARLESFADVRLASGRDADTLRRESVDVDGLIVRAQLPDDIFDHAHRLRAIVRHGAGVDMIPVAQATLKRVPVANCPGTNAVAVSQYAIAQMLALARRLPWIMARVKAGDWEGARAMAEPAQELAGQTLGIIGVGAIGAELGRAASQGLGMQVIGHQRRLDRVPPPIEAVALDDLLRRSDVVVLACPLTPETRGLLDAARLRLMKSEAFLINVSRGLVVDQSALFDALSAGRLAGAALDVFEIQPLPKGDRLLALDSVLATPHLAGLTRQSMRRMSESAVAQMRQMLDGERPAHLVNPEILTPP